jgi:hypothetical protein
MNQPHDGPARQPASLDALLANRHTRGVLIAASRDPDAKVTFVVTQPEGDREAKQSQTLAVKIPVTGEAGLTVEHEGRMLVELRRMRLGAITSTIPRYVESRQVAGRPVLVSTAMPGAPMSIGYHQWMHTARPVAVKRDFDLAEAWLTEFQAASARLPAPVTWAGDVAEALTGRWDGHPALDAARRNLMIAHARLTPYHLPETAVHGDFWFGNLLLSGGKLTGVVDWENSAPSGQPLRDVARFVLSYALYLDRHTRVGHRVLGHQGLKREGFGPGIRYGLLGRGWFPRLVRAFLSHGLGRLGMSYTRWYDVALVGLGEIAVTANEDAFGEGHLELLASLSPEPGRRFEI